MRYLATTALLLIYMSPAAAAEYWQSDNLLACLVGNGAVEMRHGATADQAMSAVMPGCQKTVDPPPKAGQDGADYTKFVQATAMTILERASGVM